MKKIIYAGTYTAKTSKGLYRFSFEDGKLGDCELFAEIKSPKYVCVTENGIASVNDFPNERAGVTLFDENGTVLDEKAFEERTSCYITYQNGKLYTANYHEGSFSVLDVNDRHLKLDQNIQIQNGAGCHQVLLWKDKILIPSLFLDRVMIYTKDYKREGSIRFEHGTGPRHGVFTKDQEYLYLVSELSNELFVMKTGSWEVESKIPILANNEMHVRDSAAIRLSDDEKYLYVSTRTKDVISVIELKNHKPELKQVISCFGKHPRDFILLDGYLLCANRHSNEVVSIKINEDGTLGAKVSSMEVPEVVSLAVKE